MYYNYILKIGMEISVKKRVTISFTHQNRAIVPRSFHITTHLSFSGIWLGRYLLLLLEDCNNPLIRQLK